jgi:chitodextrinase
VGYGREIYVQGSSGKVLAFSEGWGLAPAQVLAWANIDAGRLSIDIDLLQTIDPITGTVQSEPLAPQADIVAVLLQRSEDGGPWEDRILLPPEITSFRDTDIEPNTSYAYRAQNLMSDGSNSDFTPAQDVVQSYPDLPGAPTLDPVQVDGAQTLSLSWSPTVGSVVEHYVVERALSGGGPFTELITLNGDTFSHQDTGLTPNTTYYYQVRAANASGTSGPSNIENGTTHGQTLPAPENFQATLVGTTEIHLTWDAGPAGADAVIEMNAFGEVGYTHLDIVGAPDGTYTLNIGEPGAYSFRIKYVQDNNESPYAYSTTTMVITDTRLLYLPVMQR